MKAQRKWWLAMAAMPLLTLIGCGAEPARTGVSLTTPEALRQLQAVDPTALSATVSVNGASYNLLPDADSGNWSTVIEVPAREDLQVTITWYEIYDGVRLQLARQTQPVSTGSDGAAVEFGDAYVVDGEGFDRDNDGFSNLEERNAGTSPIDSTDRPDNASLSLTIILPPQVAALRGGVDATAVRGGVQLPLVRQSGAIFAGSVAGLATGLEVPLTVRVNSSLQEAVLVAEASATVTLATGENLLTIEAADFSTAADTDADGRTNIEEIRQGRNPLALVDHEIAVTSNPPVIDGLLDDAAWSGLLLANGGEVGHTLDTLIFSEGSGLTEDGLRSEWSAVADADRLYIALRIVDNTISFDSNLQWWDDDSIEWYLDGDYSRLAGFDGIDDMHLTFRVGDEQLFINQNSIEPPAGLVFAISQAGFDSDIASGRFSVDINEDGVTDTGYNLEISVPLAQLGLAVGQPFGINFEYNDDDDGGGRDSKYSWVGETGADIASIDPRAMGTGQINE